MPQHGSSSQVVHLANWYGVMEHSRMQAPAVLHDVPSQSREATQYGKGGNRSGNACNPRG